MDKRLILTTDLKQLMLDEVIKLAPEEACGLLAGRENPDSGRRIEAVLPVANQLHSRVRFYMDPAEQLAAFNWMDGHGLELLGIYHSHPAGPPTPSPTDLAEFAYPGVAYLIWSPQDGEWQARVFEIEGGDYGETGLVSLKKSNPGL